jgi:hypothetical protein
MTTTNAAITAVKTNTAIDTLISAIKNLWGAAQSNYMKLGEHFSQLRSETEAYKKNEKTGISYAKAVQQTGVPRSTAEFYRSLYETCADNGIPTAVFLALQDSGVNLANKRFESARQMKELQTLKVTDSDAVEELAERIKKDCPAKGIDGSGSLLERIANSQNDVVHKKEGVEQTQDPDYKKFLQSQLKSDESKTLALQLRVIEVLVETFGVVDVTESFKSQPALRENLWAFVKNTAAEFVAGFASQIPQPKTAATGKQTTKQKKKI